jgi:hypothetical protein
MAWGGVMISTHLTVSAFGGRYNYLHRGLDTFTLGVSSWWEAQVYMGQ